MRAVLEPFVLPTWAEFNRDDLIDLPTQRVRLANLPTPIEAFPMPGLPEDTQMLIKRDDITGGICLTGNKIRKLDFTLAVAVIQDADTIITVGGTQSNHVRATMAASRRLGFSPVAVLRDDSESHSNPDSGNLFMDRLFDADIRIHPKEGFNGWELVLKTAAELQKDGRKPYCIPMGASNGLGCWGYFECFQEIVSQVKPAERPLTIVGAVGSGSTVCGLAFGADLYRRGSALSNVSVRGYCVANDSDFFYDKFDTMMKEISKTPTAAREMVTLSDAVGKGYGKTSVDQLQFLSRIARETGIVLDPTYTSKAAFQMSKDIANGTFDVSNRTVVFTHTGGGPGAFPYAQGILDANCSA